MGIVGPRNAWWQDVLEHGAASQFASFFDIDWEPLKPELRNRVLLPILGDHYGRVLDKGELRLQYEDGRFLVRYHEAVLPIDPAHASADPGLPAPRSRGPAGTGRRARPGAPGHRGGRRRSAGAVRPGRGAPGRASARRGAGQAPAGRPRARVPRGEGVRGGRGLARERHSRRAGELRPARRRADRAGVSRRVLGGRRGRDQLPAVLRHQRPGGDPDGGPRRFRGGAPAPARPGRRGTDHGVPDRPPRRSLHARALSRVAPSGVRRGARAGGAGLGGGRCLSTSWSRRC